MFCILSLDALGIYKNFHPYVTTAMFYYILCAVQYKIVMIKLTSIWYVIHIFIMKLQHIAMQCHVKKNTIFSITKASFYKRGCGMQE